MNFRPILLLCLALLSNPATSAEQAISHLVMVWLKAEISPEQKQEIMSAAQQLSAIPGVISVQAGLPVASERSIVDDSFSFGINIGLSDASAIDAYLKHPIHVNYVDTHIKGKTRKLLIYDF
ncbi:MAG: Dabb family protein [Cellvibrionaceae bacterium]